MSHEIVLAADWFAIGRSLGDSLKGMIEDSWIPASCVLFVIFVGWKTRGQVGAILAAILMASAVMWGATNMGWLSDTTGETVKEYDRTNPVEPVDGS